MNMALPNDVRLTNAVANTVFVLAALVLAAAAVAWVARLPVFALRGIVVDGEMSRSSVAAIRANAAPQLQGNFFTINLAAARAAFETVPWVRQAIVRRVWPNRLAVTLTEHQAAAYWEDDNGDERLVNLQGEVFEANLGDVEEEGLPTLAGPEGSAAQMLALYRRLQPALAPLEAEVETLRQSRRGSFTAELDNGATIEIGRGTDDVLVQRTERFVRTLPQVMAQYPGRALQYADLRHNDAYALRIQGVSTLLTPPPPVRNKPAPRPAAARQR
ncbi:cell division protein FtsQ/DivIB [Aquincola tertiaricarbonis]|uniref:Cell division protein FtsQ n=1 Tax=Aquincola tertiaricarbonis TaxID=391953 RepID=A0ABY4S891_AQUTE|nr:cell division protein FtsQ/DivIB [Aquincola tertiaricarbonis]URI09577.1 cell division protein FtsQ/DivIB [Aquincola tertiaricarbonis]